MVAIPVDINPSTLASAVPSMLEIPAQCSPPSSLTAVEKNALSVSARSMHRNERQDCPQLDIVVQGSC